MRRSRFREEQIIGVLKEHQAGLSAQELCRKYGVSDATFYKWRSKYGGMDLSDARRLKALEDDYVFPEVAAKMAKTVRQHQADKAIDELVAGR